VRDDLPDLGGGQVDAELAQQVGGLVRPEREVCRPELQQPTLASQPAERTLWALAGVLDPETCNCRVGIQCSS